MTRYLLVVPALALLGAAPPADSSAPLAKPAQIVSPVPATCDKTGSYAQGERTPPRLKRLGELPPAEAYMAVYRTDERGCLDPLLARDRQGIRQP
ncbi:MAG TPA: hypothetical protein VFK50_07245 [Sphingomicrobium sp.]|nr:hypothetical protein [Sphingomicrobium sp.]